MPIVLDCEGEPCPNPVLRCKQVLRDQSPDRLDVIVDNDAAKENVCRFLRSQRWDIEHADKKDRLWTIRAVPLDTPDATTISASNPEACACTTCGQKMLVFLGSDVIGRGDDELGSRLMQNFIATLPELGEALWRIIMVNGAVRLATTDSPVINKLKALENAGVSILVCGTCLEFFGLMEQKAVGDVTNMLDVVTSQQVADKVITV